MSPESSVGRILIFSYVHESYPAKKFQYLQPSKITLKQNLKIVPNELSGDILSEQIGKDFRSILV